MVSWLKECEICNAGLCSTVDTLIKEDGMGLREASRELARQAEEHFKKEGASIEDSFSADAILSRYRWHTNRIKRKVCDNHTEDPTDSTVIDDDKSEFE